MSEEQVAEQGEVFVKFVDGSAASSDTLPYREAIEYATEVTVGRNVAYAIVLSSHFGRLPVTAYDGQVVR